MEWTLHGNCNCKVDHTVLQKYYNNILILLPHISLERRTNALLKPNTAAFLTRSTATSLPSHNLSPNVLSILQQRRLKKLLPVIVQNILEHTYPNIHQLLRPLFI